MSRRGQGGFTLIEMMITLVIASLLVAMLLSIFARMSFAFREQQDIVAIQQTITAARTAFERDAKLDITLIAMTRNPVSAQKDAIKAVDLPQTATPSELLMLLGALFSLIAIIFAVLARRTRLA